jgi:hypothetical protein
VDAESRSGMPLTPEEDALCQQLEQQVDSEIARSAAALIRRMASEADGLWDRLNQVYMALRGEIGEESVIHEEIRRLKQRARK